ncbi:MAG: (2Fe-2S) ferredoxin domain-containing protein [Planctomycetaceae bacterium]|jgi:iron-hydrogenase subunit alpha|nr:(2Fe-2S) ferredoxin domain-containing protein [Planctomycetaceae bacterium]
MKIKIEICLGTTCHLFGSSELVDIESRLPVEIADQVEVVYRACLEACHSQCYKSAPFVRINETRLIYEADAVKIIEVLQEEAAKIKHDADTKKNT